MPTARPVAWPPAIDALATAFRIAARTPRLEFVEERWPDLGRALGAAGLACTSRLPVLITDCRPQPCEKAAGVVLLAPHGPTGLVAAALAGLNAAFGQRQEPAGAAAEAAQLDVDLARGRCRLAVVLAAGQPVAGASLVGDRVAAELAGVWTAAELRGRGFAKSVCAVLLDGFFAAGGRFVWAAAQGAAATALYRSLGFRPVGHQLEFFAPDA